MTWKDSHKNKKAGDGRDALAAFHLSLVSRFSYPLGKTRFVYSTITCYSWETTPGFRLI